MDSSQHPRTDKKGRGKSMSRVFLLQILAGLAFCNAFVYALRFDLNSAAMMSGGGLLESLDPIQERLEESEQIVDQWISKIPDLVRVVYDPKHAVPSIDEPFVFYHNRKAGGSVIRKRLQETAEKNHWKAWIPCNSKKWPCTPFGMVPTQIDSKFSIYAGHINYVNIHKVWYEQNAENPKGPKSHHKSAEIADHKSSQRAFHKSPQSVETMFMGNKMHKFHTFAKAEKYNTVGTCITNIRETVSRVVSCWNFRMIQYGRDQWEVPPADAMTPDDWDALLPRAIDHFGDGCNNEIGRIFGSSVYEPEINALNLGSERFPDELDRVLGRMSRCVLVRPDRCEDSNTVVRYFLPWLKGVDLCERDTIKNKKSRRPGAEALSADARKVVLEHNKFDDMAYRFGEKLFESQLHAAVRAEQQNVKTGTNLIHDQVFVMPNPWDTTVGPKQFGNGLKKI